MRSRMPLDQNGMSVVIVLFTLGIFSLAMSSVLALAAQKRTLFRQMNIPVIANIIKLELVGIVLAPKSWQATQAMNAEAFAGFNSAQPAILDLYISQTEEAFYKSSKASAGFDLNGNRCAEFVAEGNDLCPFRYKITLKNRAFQNGNWIDTIHFELIFKPKSPMPLNTTVPEFTFDLVRNLNDQSVESACIAVNGVYDPKTNSCSSQLTSYVALCSADQTYRGPAMNGGANHCDTRTVASTACVSGSVVKGFDADGTPICGRPL